jgi:hypothetical protein
VPPTETPTAEPTVAVIDVATDANARSNITPVARATATAKATESATPAATPTGTPRMADEDLVGGIVMSSMDPLLAGGRLGLIGGLLVGAAFLVVQRVRSRK